MNGNRRRVRKMDVYRKQAIILIKKSIKRGILNESVAQALMELFDEEAGEHSPSYAYGILEQVIEDQKK